MIFHKKFKWLEKNLKRSHALETVGCNKMLKLDVDYAALAELIGENRSEKYENRMGGAALG